MIAPPANARFEVAILGLGYVGIPLSLGFAEGGCRTLGFDSDQEKIRELQTGHCPLRHLPDSRIHDCANQGLLEFTNDRSRLAESEAIIICVPTPLRKHQDPDLSHILSAGEEIAPYLQPGMLISLESSTYPGTTREELRIVLEKISGLIAGKDFHLVFSPEREDPGRSTILLRKMPKVIGGFTKACLDRGIALYERAFEHLVPVSSCETAEAVKLTENIFRFINIALANELKRIYSPMGIDIWEVIDAAKTKPFGYMPFYPGPGVGGHCIPIDPYYLTWKAKEFNLDTRFIELAGQINRSMPYYVVNHLLEAMNAEGHPLRGSRILVLGIAYKAGISDDRESPSYLVMDLLQSKGAHVEYYDPFVPHISEEHPRWSGLCSLDWSPETLSTFDAAIVCTPHPDVNYTELADRIPLIIDACNRTPKNRKAHVVPA